ncbi:MAG TPA: ABC transporter substrate-binding protein [Xanthomonadales bacterium]|nr:ABC transporter substrate-binding protein [Xanthomonadales bacterium]
MSKLDDLCRACTLLLSLTLTACVEEPPEPSADGEISVYRHAMDGAPTNLDPAQASNIYAKFFAVNLYDTLYRYKYLARPYELESNLAEGMPQVSDDGLIYTIRIKPGVHFIDDPVFENGRGRAVTAQDFVYSIKRHFDPEVRSSGSWLWAGRIVGMDEWQENGADHDREVPGLRALDDRTIQVQLIQPFPQLTHTLTQGFSAIVPREAAEHYGAELSLNPVGSGPYRLTSFDSARAVLERNPGFREEPFSLAREGYDAELQSSPELESLEGKIPPFTDRIEVEFIVEDAARWNAFIAGETDFIKVPVSQFDAILESRNPPALNARFEDRFSMDASLESGLVMTYFNMSDPQIGIHPDPERNERNRALRCAIVKGFDWHKRNEVFYYGLGKVFPGIIPPTTPEYQSDQDFDYVSHDPDGARNLLLRNGWHEDNLPTLQYGMVSGVTTRQMFEQFRSFVNEIGYPVEKIEPLTYASYGDYSRAFQNREVMLITASWIMDYPDAENTIQLFYGPNASPGSNTSNYDDDEFNELYRASSTMQPSPMRTTMYNNMNRLVMKDCAAIAGISRTLILMWNRKVTMVPDRSFIGGGFFRFVQVEPDLTQ